MHSLLPRTDGMGNHHWDTKLRPGSLARPSSIKERGSDGGFLPPASSLPNSPRPSSLSSLCLHLLHLPSLTLHPYIFILLSPLTTFTMSITVNNLFTLGPAVVRYTRGGLFVEYSTLIPSADTPHALLPIVISDPFSRTGVIHPPGTSAHVRGFARPHQTGFAICTSSGSVTPCPGAEPPMNSLFCILGAVHGRHFVRDEPFLLVNINRTSPVPVLVA